MDSKHPGIFVRLPDPQKEIRAAPVPCKDLTESADSVLDVQTREDWPRLRTDDKKLVLISKAAIPKTVGRRGTLGTSNIRNSSLLAARQHYWSVHRAIETEKVRSVEGDEKAKVSLWEVKVKIPSGHVNTPHQGEEHNIAKIENESSELSGGPVAGLTGTLATITKASRRVNKSPQPRKSNKKKQQPQQ